MSRKVLPSALPLREVLEASLDAAAVLEPADPLPSAATMKGPLEHCLAEMEKSFAAWSEAANEKHQKVSPTDKEHVDHRFRSATMQVAYPIG